MRSNQLLLIVPVHQPKAGSLVEAALFAATKQFESELAIASIEDVLTEESRLDAARMVWIVLDYEADPSGDSCDTQSDIPSDAKRAIAGSGYLSDLAYLCEERHLPALLSRPDETGKLGHSFSSALTIAPPESDPQAVAAVATAMWQQSATIRTIKGEMEVHQRHQQGLCLQIDHLDKEMRLAAKLQSEMVPQNLPDLPGFDLEAFYRPASYVSGDIYDVLRLDDDHLGIFIADATGHGVAAAMMTVYIKRSLQTRKIDPTLERGFRLLDPSETLVQLNHDMVRLQTSNVRFCTAAYGILNTKTRQLQIARAGHPFPFILRNTGVKETIECEGPLLGVFPEAEFDIGSYQLEPGDRLLIYSDGFEVAFDDEADDDGHKRMANERYTEEFRDLAHGTLADAVGRLTSKLNTQSGSLHQRDDLTVLLVGVRRDIDEVQRQAQSDQNATPAPLSRQKPRREGSVPAV